MSLEGQFKLVLVSSSAVGGCEGVARLEVSFCSDRRTVLCLLGIAHACSSNKIMHLVGVASVGLGLGLGLGLWLGQGEGDLLGPGYSQHL